MWNPGQDRRNRRARRQAMRYNGDGPWASVKNLYGPLRMPINLGINQYKEDHPGEVKRISYYKEAMWKAHNELKTEPSSPENGRQRLGLRTQSLAVRFLWELRTRGNTSVNTPNLRDKISQDISEQQIAQLTTQAKCDQNRHSWVQITTDRIVAAVANSYSTVDVPAKYEIQAGQTLPVSLVDPDETETGTKTNQTYSKYSSDNGFNRYYFEYTDYLKGLYSLPDGVLQSEHDNTQEHGSSVGPTKTLTNPTIVNRAKFVRT